MITPAWYLTETAQSHFDDVLRQTAQRWGFQQAQTYRDALMHGFDDIAQNYPVLLTPHRKAMAKGTGFSLHLVEHHYVCFIVYDQTTVIVVGIFHERMNLPSRLKELRASSMYDLEAVEAQIANETALRNLGGL